MAWLAVDEDGSENIFEMKPWLSEKGPWWNRQNTFIGLPKGSIKKLIGRDLTWEDEPVELKVKDND